MIKKLLTILLTLCLVVSLSPLKQTNAAGITTTPTLKVNETKVAFAGHEWWVIGYNGTGVYTTANDKAVTLFTVKEIGKSRFRKIGSSSDVGYTKFHNNYYANNPEGMTNWTTPNEYAGSTLQQKMVTIASGLPTKEQALIKARNIIGGGTYTNPSSDGIAGEGIANQKMWILSKAEVEKINNKTVLSFRTTSRYVYYWLRTPSSSDIDGGEIVIDVTDDGEIDTNNPRFVNGECYIRPALSLDLSSVLFASDASSSGKSSSTVGNLVSCLATSGTIKFTMKDTSQTVTVTDVTSDSTNGKIHFNYSGATVGTNQYVSCVLTDANGNVVYYGKLADCSSSASGSASISLSSVTTGTYTLKIFAEQANGDKYTDFCSEPVTMTLTVGESSSTVSGYSSSHTHSWAATYSKDENAHWYNCTATNCPITKNSDKKGYSTHTYDQQNISSTYLKSVADCENAAVYYYSCACTHFIKGENATTFTSGDSLGHNWSDEYSHDENYHWHECLNDNCPITDNSKKDGYKEHYGEDDGDCLTAVVCECNLTLIEANEEHEWSNWQPLEEGRTHIRYCEAQQVECKANETEKCVDEDKDGYCDKCKAEMPKAPSTGDGIGLFVGLASMYTSALALIIVENKKRKIAK